MIVGITGVFGSGKSTVAKIIAKKLHCPVIDADRVANNVLRNNKGKIKKAFGTANRGELAEIVFVDREKLIKLQKIIHPKVLAVMKKQSKSEKNIVLDVPLLIESRAHKFADIVIVVKCTEKVRIKRLLKKGFALKEIKLRTKHQMPTKEKLKYADYVIDNSKSLKVTKKQVNAVVNKIHAAYDYYSRKS